jgi:hypothetical protein
MPKARQVGIRAHGDEQLAAAVHEGGERLRFRFGQVGLRSQYDQRILRG